jgi:hypothetical protein
MSYEWIITGQLREGLTPGQNERRGRRRCKLDGGKVWMRKSSNWKSLALNREEWKKF